jgi:SEC-C motif
MPSRGGAAVGPPKIYIPADGPHLVHRAAIFATTAEIREVLMAFGRTSKNDPCPCGSGKKYKKCCLNQGIFRSNAFRAGSYGDWGEFHAGIAYVGSDQQTVFVKQETTYFDENSAVTNAETDLQVALNQSGGDEDRVIDNIQVAGYLPVESAKGIEEENAEGLPTLDYAMNELVAAHIQSNQPPETRTAFDRLTGLGYSRRHAFLMIKMVIVAELWRSSERHTSPDSDQLVKALNDLPDLPDFLQTAGFNTVPVGSGISA